MFIQTRVKKKEMVIIKLSGVLVDILCKTSSYYKSYVSRDKIGVNQFLISCQNALYVKMVDILLYYCKFDKILTSIGFEINPYDPCITNKAINGSHMKICFHADAFKLIHRKRKSNDRIIEWLCQ